MYCKKGHALTTQTLYLTKSGHKRCKICHAIWQRKKYAENTEYRERKKANQLLYWRTNKKAQPAV